MRGTLVFVHGTGTREAGYTLILERVKNGSADYLSKVSVVGVPWYKLRTDYPGLVDAALPVSGARGLAGTPPDTSVEAWQKLTEDPLFELRLIETWLPKPVSSGGIGAPNPAQQITSQVTNISTASKPLGGFSPEELQAAAQVVGGSEVLREASGRVEPTDIPSLLEVVSRAVVASMFAVHRNDAPGTQPEAMLLWDKRDALVDAIYEELAGGLRGIKSWFLEQLAKLGTGQARRHRGGLTDLSVGFFSDVFFYERRGSGIRAMIDEELRAAPRPIVVIGHSLGGIAAVDLLSAPKPPAIDLLVTVGCQAPLLFAMNALDSLQPPDQNRVPVPRWVNVFDRNDLISFRASEIFTDAADEVEDHEISSGQPFPMSHGAYFVNPKFWQLVADHWP